MVDIVTDLPRDGVLSELLHADGLVLINETIKGLSNKFIKWKEAFERQGLKVNLGKSKVMVSSGITKDGLLKCNVYLCCVCILRVKANCILCVQCCKWIHGRCADVKRVTKKF